MYVSKVEFEKSASVRWFFFYFGSVALFLTFHCKEPPSSIWTESMILCVFFLLFVFKPIKYTYADSNWKQLLYNFISREIHMDLLTMQTPTNEQNENEREKQAKKYCTTTQLNSIPYAPVLLFCLFVCFFFAPHFSRQPFSIFFFLLLL